MVLGAVGQITVMLARATFQSDIYGVPLPGPEEGACGFL